MSQRPIDHNALAQFARDILGASAKSHAALYAKGHRVVGAGDVVWHFNAEGKPYAWMGRAGFVSLHGQEAFDALPRDPSLDESGVP